MDHFRTLEELIHQAIKVEILYAMEDTFRIESRLKRICREEVLQWRILYAFYVGRRRRQLRTS